MKRTRIAAAALSFASLLAVTTNVLAARVVKTKPREVVPYQQVDESTALVTFVRTSYLLGDAVEFDLWYGETYIGELSSGTLLQYKVPPGEHIFMAMGRTGKTWTFMKADLAAGKEYFVKANPTPFHLGVADARTEERIDEWRAMRVNDPLKPSKMAKIHDQYITNARAALAAFKSGEVKPDCAHWWAPNKKGYQRKAGTVMSGCVAAADVKPEFGR